MNILPEMDISLVEAFLGPFEKKIKDEKTQASENKSKLRQKTQIFAKFERGRTKIDPMEKYNSL